MSHDEINVKFDILYRSGQSESITQKINRWVLSEIAETVEVSIRDGVSGIIMLGESIEKCQFINTMDISSIKFEIIKEKINVRRFTDIKMIDNEGRELLSMDSVDIEFERLNKDMKYKGISIKE